MRGNLKIELVFFVRKEIVLLRALKLLKIGKGTEFLVEKIRF